MQMLYVMNALSYTCSYVLFNASLHALTGSREFGTGALGLAPVR